MESLRDKTIGRLTNYRQLTGAEMAEIDTLAVALDLNENDPMWGHVLWAWAVMPRRDDLDVALRGLAAEIRSDMQSIESPSSNAGNADLIAKMDDLKDGLKLLADRPSAAAPAVSVDPKAIQSAVSQALMSSSNKGVISSADMIKIIKDAATEFVSWANAAIAAIVIGLCLFVGFQFGKSVQSGSDEAAVQRLEKQVADLTAALPKR